MPRDEPAIPPQLLEPPPNYRTQSEDTSYWAEQLWFEHLRTIGARETAELIGSACRMLDELLLAGLRREHPDANDEELEWRVATRKYGHEFVQRCTGRTLPPVTSTSELLAVALQVARTLERLRIPYLLGGSLASGIHGEPRATLDIDFAVHMAPDDARRLARELEADFHVVADAPVEAATEQGLANVVHKRPLLKVDLHVRPRRGHHAEEILRAQRVQVGDDPGDELRVATPEDVVLSKLRWYHLGGEVSDRQWRDVAGVLKRQAGRLDLAYLERWAGELGLRELLSRALLESRAR